MRGFMTDAMGVSRKDAPRYTFGPPPAVSVHLKRVVRLVHSSACLLRSVQSHSHSWNQPPALAGYNAWTADAVVREAVAREGATWAEPQADTLGADVGSEHFQALADAA